MSFKQVHHTFWTDPEIKAQSRHIQHLYLYYITGPNAHYCGVYNLTHEEAAKAVKLTVVAYIKEMKVLMDLDRVRYDEATETIFITRMMKSQLKNDYPSPSQLGGALNQLDTLHNSKLILDFFEYNKHLKGHYKEKHIDLENRMDYMKEKVSNNSTAEMPLLEKTIKKTGMPTAEKEKIFEEQFWTNYPQRDGVKAGKKIAKDFFIETIKDDDIPLTLKAIVNYSNSKTVIDNYAKDAIRFLKNEFWKDWVDVKIIDESNEPLAPYHKK